MNHAQAEEYLCWHYENPYIFYNIPEEGREETRQEIFNDPDKHYFSVLNNGCLFGIYEYELSDHLFEIGLGICPNETGKGNGVRFVSNCIAFGKNHFNRQSPVSLDVAAFNKRAIHLYKKIGFVETGQVTRLSFGTPVCFVRMVTTKTNFRLTYQVL
jgi:Acetyltransferases, including N-acetylases of ribosomal proteins